MKGISDKTDLSRIFIYGPSQHKKSWWAGTAAEAGFNVLVANGDKPAKIYHMLSKEAQERMNIINVVGEYNFTELVIRLLRRKEPVLWNITGGHTAKKYDPRDEFFEIDLTRLDENWVFVLDSWTAISTTLVERHTEENGIDLTDAESKDLFNQYTSMYMLADWIISQLKKLPCHVIVIGHPDIWEKAAKNKSDTRQASYKLEFVRTQPVSISRPHASKLVKNFTDCFRFRMIGNQFKIDSSSQADADGGSTTVPPDLYNWDDLKFPAYCKLAGIPTPITRGIDRVSDLGCKYYPRANLIPIDPVPATEPVAEEKPKVPPVLSATPINAGKSLATLFQKKGG
jgi:hypothetical protein